MGSGQLGRVTIMNQGNTADTYSLSFQSPGGLMLFQKPVQVAQPASGQVENGYAQIPAGERFQVEAGQSAAYPFRARLRSRPIMGGEASYPFTIIVTSPERRQDLPGQLCAVTAGVLRAEAARPEGWFDLIHSHYWLSGQVGWLAKERWGVPLVHTMHTMGRVKNRSLAPDDRPEPELRIIGEQQVVDAADRLVANTAAERADLIDR